jgi:parallel beta-helix repeat protein
MKTLLRFSALTCAFLFTSTMSTFAQGGLTPPGAPVPTMKTLDQIEARTPLDATHTPGDASNEFIIAQAGSYYLTGNLNVAKTNGIHIAAAGVTVDLNGFQIARTSGSGHGIQVDAAANNCTIRNGSITGFLGNGVFAAPSRGGIVTHVIASNCSVGLLTGDGWRIDSCNAHDNTGNGIQTGNGCTISYCSASNNAGYGIVISNGSTMLDCFASGNQGGVGIFAGSDCTLTHCTASGNTSAGSTSAGIFTSSRCTLIACTVTNTDNTNPTPSSSTGMGIRTVTSSTIQDCTVTNSKGDGILVGSGCVLRNNTCASNATGAGSGVHATGSQNRIEGNATINNPTGFKFEAAGNLIIKNSNTGGSTPFDVIAGNSIGDRIDVYNGGAGANITSTNPWANFLY